MLRKMTGYLAECVSRKIPFLSEIYRNLELSDQMPRFPEARSIPNFVTDGEHLFVNPQIVKGLRLKRKELEQELAHELLHIYLRHTVFYQKSKRRLKDSRYDEEVNAWLQKAYGEVFCFPSDQTGRYGRHYLWEVRQEKEEKNKDAGHSDSGESDDGYDVWKTGEWKADEQKTVEWKSGEWKADEQKSGEWKAGDQNAGEWNAGEWKKWKESAGKADPSGNGAGSMAQGELAGSDVWIMTGNLKPEGKGRAIGFGKGGGGCGEGFCSDGTMPELSYLDTMRQYTEVKEKQSDTDEEMDPVIYAYGLELYGNVALVEPNEFAEKTVVELCIAVDISGSCMGEQAKRFMRHVKQVACELPGIGGMDIWIFLCDDEIRREFHVTDIDSFPEDSDLFVSGGGTNFVPVFERVSGLLQEKGRDTALFYYTDGCGKYPDVPPDFQTYFILMESDYREMIPDWIQVITID